MTEPSSSPPSDEPPARWASTALRLLSLAWVPLAASALSLVLSVASIVVATRDPEVMLILPPIVRIAQGADFDSAYLYLQPAFVSTGANDRAEVIRDLVLVVQPDGGGDAVEFTWDETARLVYDDESGEIGYEYLADPVPLLVSPTTAQSPLGLFDAPDGWAFEAGTYRLTVRASRVVAAQPLEEGFDLTLDAEQVDQLNASRGTRFLTFATGS
jgi:hypothetical protein